MNKRKYMTPRKTAKANGRSTYHGDACSKGHTLRYTVSMQCVECAKIYAKKHKGRSDKAADRERAHDRRYLLEQQKGCCAYCGASDDGFYIDYLEPIELGGGITLGNKQLLCKRHYDDKEKRGLDDMIYRRRNGIPAITEWDSL